ncbi:MAG: ABC transporter permease [Prevotellaceae bacterium]|jgi:putative ABC transport system permease protein|nr:ABC transporter permease [Prevotellaceae bacterium]
MYKVYFKQALHILKQDRLISAISIIGTALAITMIMLVYMVQEVKTANVLPEIHRDRSMYLNMMDIKYNTGGRWRAMLKYEALKECLLPLKTPENISATVMLTDAVVNMEGSAERNTYQLRQTDDNFWKIYSFPFTEGKAFTKEDFDSGIPVVVISQKIAKEIFKGQQAVGKTIDINFIPYKVLGVVKNISMLCRYSFADLWIPYTSVPSYTNSMYNFVALAKHKNDFDAIKEEVLVNQKKYNAIDTTRVLDLNGPYTVSQMLLDIYSSEDAANEIKANTRRNILILVIALIIPAINLSSFSLSRIRKRMSEIGVRKAFGANKFSLIGQVLYENMITSLIGGALGFILSFIAVVSLRDLLLSDSLSVLQSGEFGLSMSAFFSLSVFLAVFLACIALNVLSASIPAFRASRLPIVNALKS